MRTEAQKRARAKYEKRLRAEGKIVNMTCRLNRDQADAFRSKLNADGITANGFFNRAVLEYLNGGPNPEEK